MQFNRVGFECWDEVATKQGKKRKLLGMTTQFGLGGQSRWPALQ